MKKILFALSLICALFWASPAFASYSTASGTINIYEGVFDGTKVGGWTTGQALLYNDGLVIQPGKGIVVTQQDTNTSHYVYFAFDQPGASIRVYSKKWYQGTETSLIGSPYYQSYNVSTVSNSYLLKSADTNSYSKNWALLNPSGSEMSPWYSDSKATMLYNNSATPVYFRIFGSSAYPASVSSELIPYGVAPPVQHHTYVYGYSVQRTAPWYLSGATNPYQFTVNYFTSTDNNSPANTGHVVMQPAKVTGKVYFDYFPPLYTFWGSPGVLPVNQDYWSYDNGGLDLSAYFGLGIPTGSNSASVFGIGTYYGNHDPVANKVPARFVPDDPTYPTARFFIDTTQDNQGPVMQIIGTGGGSDNSSDWGTDGTTVDGKPTIVPGTVTSGGGSPTGGQADTAINWNPLRQASDTMKTKFPFSLPWDIYNGLAGVGGSSTQTAPTFSLNMTSKLVTINQSVDLSMWNQIMPYVRSFELIVFSLLLIWAWGEIARGT